LPTRRYTLWLDEADSDYRRPKSRLQQPIGRRRTAKPGPRPLLPEPFYYRSLTVQGGRYYIFVYIPDEPAAPARKPSPRAGAAGSSSATLHESPFHSAPRRGRLLRLG